MWRREPTRRRAVSWRVGPSSSTRKTRAPFDLWRCAAVLPTCGIAQIQLPVEVTASLWTGVRAWMLGRGVVSARDVVDARRHVSSRGIPADGSISRKVALGADAAETDPCGRDFSVTAVLGDTEFGDNATLRRTAATV